MIEMLQDNWEKEYAYAGSFQTALMRAVECADTENLARLALGFPDIVKAYYKWQERDL